MSLTIGVKLNSGEMIVFENCHVEGRPDPRDISRTWNLATAQDQAFDEAGKREVEALLGEIQ